MCARTGREKAPDLGPVSAICGLCSLGRDHLTPLFLNFLIFKIGDEAFIRSPNCNENEIKQLKKDDDDEIRASHPLALGIVRKHLGASYFCNRSAQSEEVAGFTRSEAQVVDSTETDRPTNCRHPAGFCPMTSLGIHRNI